MNQEQEQSTENKIKRVHELPKRLSVGEKTQISIRFGHKLFNEILDIAESRRLTFSNAARLLLHMGRDEYNLNQLAGRTKKKDIEADYNKRLAEAQALAAQREARKQSRNKKAGVIPAVTVMLAGTEPEDNNQ